MFLETGWRGVLWLLAIGDLSSWKLSGLTAAVITVAKKGDIIWSVDGGWKILEDLEDSDHGWWWLVLSKGDDGFRDTLPRWNLTWKFSCWRWFGDCSQLWSTADLHDTAMENPRLTRDFLLKILIHRIFPINMLNYTCFFLKLFTSSSGDFLRRKHHPKSLTSGSRGHPFRPRGSSERLSQWAGDVLRRGWARTRGGRG